MEKKEEVFQYLRKDTQKKIKRNDYDHFGLDAQEIGIVLKMDRSNTSRILNQLYNEGRLIKTSTRPILFIDRLSIDTAFTDSHVPSLIPKNKDIFDFIDTFKDEQSEDVVNSFSRYIINPRHSKMSEPIKKAQSAILYPYGLNTIILGEKGSGRFQFAKSMANYAKEVKFEDKKSKTLTIECLNYQTLSGESLLTLLFGKYSIESDTLKKGVFQMTKNKVIILNNIDQLSTNTLSTLYNAILDKQFSPINSNKIIDLNTLIIATATKKSILDTTDIHRCFPMLINIPNLNERSIAEKLVIILQYFQDESIKINKTIRISKDALSCFVMSEYKGNLAHLRAEIQQSCAMGYQKYIQNNTFYIDIEFDEISTPVLTNIFDISERIDDLHDVLNIFPNEFLFFSTHHENQELKLLYDLNQAQDGNQNMEINIIDDELINQCIQDISNASIVQLNIFRSFLLQKIYDELYPILKDHIISKNENLLYGLLRHLSNLINKITSDEALTNITSLTTKIARKLDYEYAQKLINRLESFHRVQLPKSETDYVATYLYFSSQWINNQYIQLLIVSTNAEDSKNYADYINSQFYKTHAHYLTISQQNSLDTIAHSIIEKMKKIDLGKGVILATDSPLVEKIKPILARKYNGEYTILSDMTIQKLVIISKKIESLGVTIQSINVMTNQKLIIRTSEPPRESHTKKLLNEIQNKLLSESLVFLNPEKACQSLYNVLMNIINDLNIPYSDDLLIKFLFHTAFTIERCIHKEPYSYPKARTLIKKYPTLYGILDQNLKVINEIFSTQIPVSELGFIIEIFLPYITH